jgi:putative transposase
MRPRRKKRLSLHRGAVPTATRPDQHWSIDFVHDQLASGHTFRVLTVIDQSSRESGCLETNVSLTGQSVVDALEQAAQSRSLPTSITVDHSSRRPSTSGPTGAASSSTSFGQGSPLKTR